MSPAVLPPALRRWFVVHFVADLVFALPLFFAPAAFLELFGWKAVDPAMTRIVAAALFGIGIESFLGRNADREVFRGMLNLKIIWSSCCSVGLLWSVLEGGPSALWLFLAIFASFCGLWSYWRIQLGRQ